MAYKIDYIENFAQMKDDERLEKLEEIVTESFYNTTESKTMWDMVLNDFMKPIIKKLHPRYNSDVVLEKVI